MVHRAYSVFLYFNSIQHIKISIYTRTKSWIKSKLGSMIVLKHIYTEMYWLGRESFWGLQYRLWNFRIWIDIWFDILEKAGGPTGELWNEWLRMNYRSICLGWSGMMITMCWIICMQVLRQNGGLVLSQERWCRLTSRSGIGAYSVKQKVGLWTNEMTDTVHTWHKNYHCQALHLYMFSTCNDDMVRL